MFNDRELPGRVHRGSSSDAAALFALLTGRVTSIGGTAVLDEATNEYAYLGTRRQAGKHERVLVLRRRTRGALTPTLTINGGLRWDVQMPFRPINDIMSQSTFADACGVSGIGADGAVPVLPAGRDRRQVVPKFVQFDQGIRGLQHRLEQHRAQRRRRVAAERAERMAAQDPRRSGAGDAPRRLLGGLRPRGHGGLHRPVRRQSRQPRQRHAQRTPTATWSCRASMAAAVQPDGPLATAGASTIPAVTCDASGQTARRLSDRRRGRTAPTTSTSSRPDIQVASARTYNVSFQRALSRNMAVDIRYVGTRGVESVDRGGLQRDQHHRERLHR